MSCGRSLAPAILLFALCSGGAVRAKDLGYVNVSVLTDPAPLVRFTSGKHVYVEGLVDGRWVGRYWNAGGRINVPYELYTDNAFDLEIGDLPLSSGWQWIGEREENPTRQGARHVVVELSNTKRPVRLKIHTLLDGTPVLVRWLEITNTSAAPVTLSRVSPWSGHLFHVQAYRQALAAGASEVFKVGYFERITHGWEGWLDWKTLDNETFKVECHVGHGFNDPFFVVRNQAAGEYFIGHLAWSANWDMTFRSEQDAAGKLADFWFNAGPWASITQRVISPKESVTTPAMHLGYVEGELDDAVQAMHDHIRGFVMPPRDPKRAYLIQYAVPGDQGYIAKKAGDLEGMNESNILKQVDLAAALGAELFIVDAGWWDVYGDWTASPKRFPHGLAPIADYIHKKGMLFGLYNEVTGGRGDWTYSNMYKQHPDWFLWPYALVDLTNPAAVEFVERQSEEMIERYKVDLFRLDYNPGFDGEMGQKARDGFEENLYWRYYEASYRMFERLKAKYPQVIFQQAAAGGGRNDLGFTSRFDEEYTTDGLDMPPVLQDYSGQTLGLPPEILVSAFGIPEHSQNRGHLDTHLRLSFSLGTPWLAPVAPTLDDLNPQIRAQYLRYANLYKSFIRPLLATCLVYHHAPVNSRDGVDENPWFAMEFAAPDRTRGWATIVRLNQSDSDVYQFRPRGLDPGKTYEVTLDNKNTTLVIDGLHLIQDGLPVRLESVESSELLLFRAK